MAILTTDLPTVAPIGFIGNAIRYMQSQCRNFGTPPERAIQSLKFLEPKILQKVARG
jgi:hypothetical protein